MIVALVRNKYRGEKYVKALSWSSGLIVVALLAIGFAAVPLWRSKALKGRCLLIGAIALFMLGVGGGTYWMLGRPYLACARPRAVKHVT